MKNIAYYEGRTSLIDEMMIPANDRAFYFGDGIYEAATVYNHKIFALDDHLDRMFNSAAIVNIKLPYTREEYAAILKNLVKQVDHEIQFLYWQVSRASAPRGHAFPGDAKPTLYVYSKPLEKVEMKDDYHLISVPDTRYFHCNCKTLNLIVNVMAADQAKSCGCQEVVFIRDGLVTEGSHSNIHIIKEGKLITHPLDNLILPGTERKHILRYCDQLGIPYEERAFSLDELKAADEIVISSTSQPFMRAISVDGQPAGGKDPEICEKIRSCYWAEVADLYE